MGSIVKVIVGTVECRKTLEQVRAGEMIKLVPFAPEEGIEHYLVRATGGVEDVNPGKLMQFPGRIWSGQLSQEDCTVRYMPGEGTAIAQIG